MIDCFYAGSTNLQNLNVLLSGRLNLNHFFILKYGINLFGHNIITTEYLILDSSYINILLRYGLFFVIVFYIYFYKLIERAYVNKNYTLLIILIILLINGFTESILYKTSINAFLLYISTIIFNSKEVAK